MVSRFGEAPRECSCRYSLRGLNNALALLLHIFDIRWKHQVSLKTSMRVCILQGLTDVPVRSTAEVMEVLREGTMVPSPSIPIHCYSTRFLHFTW